MSTMSPTGNLRVSVVVVNFNGGKDLLECLRSVQLQRAANDIVIVDNASSDGSVAAAQAEFPKCKTILNAANLGFAQGANIGAHYAETDILLFLNPDTRLEPECVALLCDALARHDGVAGPSLTVEATGAREYGWRTNHLGMPRALHHQQKPLFVPGCALATTRATFDAMGHFDDRYFLFVEDLEYCWRVLVSGREVQVVEGARAWHRGGGSAPGGYLGKPVYETSEMRVSLRERNTLAAMISCARGPTLLFVVPACVLRSLAIALVSTAMGRPRLAMSILSGLGWNARGLRATLQRRRALWREPHGVVEAERRMDRGAFLLQTLRDYGLPRFVPNRR